MHLFKTFYLKNVVFFKSKVWVKEKCLLLNNSIKDLKVINKNIASY